MSLVRETDSVGGGMQSAQVSVWVPIAVGVIGVLGVISGQLINAWREDRRWKREQEREELRWQRESGARSAQTPPGEREGMA